MIQIKPRQFFDRSNDLNRRLSEHGGSSNGVRAERL